MISDLDNDNSLISTKVLISKTSVHGMGQDMQPISTCTHLNYYTYMCEATIKTRKPLFFGQDVQPISMCISTSTHIVHQQSRLNTHICTIQSVHDRLLFYNSEFSLEFVLQRLTRRVDSSLFRVFKLQLFGSSRRTSRVLQILFKTNPTTSVVLSRNVSYNKCLVLYTCIFVRNCTQFEWLLD